jgi:low affinity Fe/Cu permease
MNHLLFSAADFLSRPPGFYWMLGAMLVCTGAWLLGIDENMITFFLSVLAIVVTGIVLIQGYRDTAAIQAKLDELILAQEKARNEVVGLEKQEPEKIAQEVEKLEEEAHAQQVREAGKIHGRGGARQSVRKALRDRPEDS